MRLCHCFFFCFRCIVSCRLTEESRKKNTIDYLASHFRQILGEWMLKLISIRRIFQHTVNSVQLMIKLINDDAPPCNRPKQHRIIYQQHALSPICNNQAKPGQFPYEQSSNQRNERRKTNKNREVYWLDGRTLMANECTDYDKYMACSITKWIDCMLTIRTYDVGRCIYNQIS